MQRVGRADHQVGGVSHAFVLTRSPRQRIVTGAASLEAMIAGDGNRGRAAQSLDILAQQTVAAAAMHDLNADDWYATVRRAAPFAELP